MGQRIRAAAPKRPIGCERTDRDNPRGRCSGAGRSKTERFVRADAALKTFRFSYPARSEQFEEWKQLRDVWDQRDEELQAAREDLKDFDCGKLTASSE